MKFKVEFLRSATTLERLLWRTLSLNHNMGNSLSLIFAFLAIITVSRVRKFYSGLKAVSKLPGPRVPFWPYAISGVLIPTTWWNPGESYHWINRFSVYKYFGSEVFAIVPFLVGPPGICISNLDVAHQIVGNGRSALTFVKSRSSPYLLEFWRSNIIYSQGDVWRKHQRVMGPVFHNTLWAIRLYIAFETIGHCFTCRYADVWSRTIQAYHDMVAAEGWHNMNVVDIPIVRNITFKLATLIIGKCGFGFLFDWTSQAPLPNGSMSIQESIRVVTSNAALMTSPKWIQKLPFDVFKKVGSARDELMQFLKEQVAERKTALSGFPKESEERSKDMFSMLVSANKAESEKLKLSDEEVVGNIFAMLFAGNGHLAETIAYAIAAALGCVSLHQDIQDEALVQIEEVVGCATIDDYPQLTKVLGIFFEALRMFPIGHMILCEAGEDTTLTTPNPVGEPGSEIIAILKATKIIVDMVGIQYNPRYFDEPEKFKSSRWEGISADSEIFTAFSFGPRTCIGRKFAIVEAVCWLTMVLRDWHVEPLMWPEETEEMWSRRALSARAGITLYVSDIPVRFVRRSR
ncbi:cytochrome P450 [Pleurotus eryngii]|uniref:Cytochrome P450 n=1 Tax=Pleurotus eryngii TaxID=5323 RepID=A0A9P6D5H5_PLEER|nr:cytochrome P450 [Pleurotus eryngii]